MFAFRRNESGENASDRQADGVGPGLQLFQQPFAGKHFFEGDQNVAAESFDPAIVNCAKPVRISAFRLEIAEQAWINPSHNRLFLRSKGIVRNRYGAMDGLPLMRVLLQSGCSDRPVAGTSTSRHCWKTAHRAVATGTVTGPDKATVYYAKDHCSYSSEHFQSGSWLRLSGPGASSL